MGIVFFLLFSSFIFYKDMTGRVFFEAEIGAIVVLGIISRGLVKRINFLAGLTFLIFGVSAIIAGTSMSQTIFHGPSVAIKTSSYGSFSSLSIMLSMCLLFFILSKKDFKNILGALFVCSFLNSLFIIFKVVVYGFKYRYAMLSNPSRDAAFICCFLPMAFFYKKYVMASVMVVAVLLTKSSTGVAGIFAAITLEIILNRKKYWYVIPTSLIALLTASYFLKGDLKTGLLQDSGRFYIWKEFYQAVLDGPTLFGFGTGTFETLGPAYQISQIPPNDLRIHDVFGWMHNDWLQILFENGFVGLTAFVLFYLSILKKSFKKKDYLFPTIILLGAVGCTQMPLHLFVFQILGVVLIGLA